MRPTGQSGRIPYFNDVRARLAILVLGCAIVLIACGEESGDVPEDRQFANDPVPTREVTATSAASPQPVAATPVTDEPVASASPETLLHSRGTPDTLYTLIDGDLFAIAPDGDSQLVTSAADGAILDIAGAPAGDRVAVLRADGDAGPVLTMYEADGTPIVEEVSIGEANGATPVAEDAAGTTSVSWSPQGREVLVLYGNSLSRVATDGEVSPVDLSEVDARILNAAISPQGTRMLLHVVDGDGAHRVFVQDLADGRLREVSGLTRGTQTGLTNVQWLPDGSGLLFVRGEMLRGVVMNGQVFSYTLGHEVPKLVATSGQGGPAATITDAVVSPDGRKVAYVISVLDGDTWAYHSMWVRELDGSLSYSVPIGARGVVLHPQWFAGGLAWEQRPAQDAPGRYVFARAGEEPVVLVEPQQARATPGASPVASPDATPGATPHH